MEYINTPLYGLCTVFVVAVLYMIAYLKNNTYDSAIKYTLGFACYCAVDILLMLFIDYTIEFQVTKLIIDSTLVTSLIVIIKNFNGFIVHKYDNSVYKKELGILCWCCTIIIIKLFVSFAIEYTGYDYLIIIGNSLIFPSNKYYNIFMFILLVFIAPIFIILAQLLFFTINNNHDKNISNYNISLNVTGINDELSVEIDAI